MGHENQKSHLCLCNFLPIPLLVGFACAPAETWTGAIGVLEKEPGDERELNGEEDKKVISERAARLEKKNKARSYLGVPAGLFQGICCR